MVQPQRTQLLAADPDKFLVMAYLGSSAITTYDKLRGDPDYEHILTEVRQNWEHYIARRRKAEWEFCLK